MKEYVRGTEQRRIYAVRKDGWYALDKGKEAASSFEGSTNQQVVEEGVCIKLGRRMNYDYVATIDAQSKELRCVLPVARLHK